MQLSSCFLVIARLYPKAFEIPKTSRLALENRIEAKKNGGNSRTAILFHKKVLPQNTYTQKNAMMSSHVFLEMLIVEYASSN